MKRLLLLLMLSCLIIALDQANAQPAKVVGKVLDVNGKGVAGVKVAVEGQKITATTSKDGSFKLEGVVPACPRILQPTVTFGQMEGFG